jgi:hypothetical protein
MRKRISLRGKTNGFDRRPEQGFIRLTEPIRVNPFVLTLVSFRYGQHPHYVTAGFRCKVLSDLPTVNQDSTPSPFTLFPTLPSLFSSQSCGRSCSVRPPGLSGFLRSPPGPSRRQPLARPRWNSPLVRPLPVWFIGVDP